MYLFSNNIMYETKPSQLGYARPVWDLAQTTVDVLPQFNKRDAASAVTDHLAAVLWKHLLGQPDLTTGQWRHCGRMLISGRSWHKAKFKVDELWPRFWHLFWWWVRTLNYLFWTWINSRCLNTTMPIHLQKAGAHCDSLQLWYGQTWKVYKHFKTCKIIFGK